MGRVWQTCSLLLLAHLEGGFVLRYKPESWKILPPTSSIHVPLLENPPSISAFALHCSKILQVFLKLFCAVRKSSKHFCFCSTLFENPPRNLSVSTYILQFFAIILQLFCTGRESAKHLSNCSTLLENPSTILHLNTLLLTRFSVLYNSRCTHYI